MKYGGLLRCRLLVPDKGGGMDSSSLLKSIAEHRRDLDALTERIKALLAAVDAGTDQAREILARYQSHKREAGEALAEASRAFQDARRPLSQTDDLFRGLSRLKDEHNTLSRRASAFVAACADGDESQKVYREIRAARRTLRGGYERIERARRDAHLAETENDEPGNKRNL